jgi:hypothetical protein
MQPEKSVEDTNQPNADVFPMPGNTNEVEPNTELPPVSNPVESAESAPNKHERHLSDPEQQPSAVATSPTLPPPNSTNVAPPPSQQPASQAQHQPHDDLPQIADDVDVIEKEWVDKAKEIIEQTRNHPYQQEQEVERLQQSYLKKRYGKDVSSPN